MLLLTFSWCSLLGLATNSLFPQIQAFHWFMGLVTFALTGLLNYYIQHIAMQKYKLDFIQSGKRGTSEIDKDLYNVYVPVTLFGTLAFAAWPWAVVPTLKNISWSWRSIGIFNTFGSYIGAMLLYDFIYYFGHLLMHHDVVFYKHIHKVHHQLTAPGNMFDNLYIHPLELFIFLWPQVLPLYLLHMHILSVVAYFFSIFAVTSMYHVGIKFPSVLPLLSPEFHDDHHRLNKVNFSFFTEIPDKLFGTTN
jgi:sterol desaturase/sphingolipid hydroxylase (fatty acid hydroxylase superfamily)